MQSVEGCVLLCIGIWFSTHVANGDELYQPNTYELLDGGDYHLNYTYCPFELDGIFNMTGRCYCYYNATTQESDCSIPGPTLVMYNGSDFSLTIHNGMTGSNTCDSCLNSPRDPDVTNLHTHGLYISPIDDNSLIVINPGESYKYSHHIISDHYPGTLWYHIHHHGSVNYQVNTGGFGALIIKNTNEDSFYPDLNLINMKSHILEVHFIWTVDNSDDCDCDDNQLSQTYSEQNGDHTINPICVIWCDMESTNKTQTDNSGAPYDLNIIDESGNTTSDSKFFLINGQVNPTIGSSSDNTWYVGEWRILKFIQAATDYFLQIKFDESLECSYYLLGRDGIYFKDGHRNICDDPTYCFLIVSPGARADVAIKCDVAGTYQIYFNNEQYSNYSDMSELPRAANNTKAFKIIISNDTSGDTDVDYVTELPTDYPDYPDYLLSLLDEDNEQTLVYGNATNDCSCSDYNTTYYSSLNNTCKFVFEVDQGSFVINDELFAMDKAAYYLSTNTIYEFIIESNVHPYHQHVSPFQLSSNVLYGMIGAKSDWVDTLGAYGDTGTFSMRILTIDWSGIVVTHCHLIAHEDSGMMTYYRITNGTVNSTTCEVMYQDPSNTPTALPTTIPTVNSSSINLSISTTEVSENVSSDEDEDEDNDTEKFIYGGIGIAIGVIVTLLILLVIRLAKRVCFKSSKERENEMGNTIEVTSKIADAGAKTSSKSSPEKSQSPPAKEGNENTNGKGNNGNDNSSDNGNGNGKSNENEIVLDNSKAGSV